MRRLLPAIASMMAFAPGLAGASPEAKEDENNGEYKTVVTASRFEETDDEAAAPVTVIGGDEIDARPIGSADELLDTTAATTARRPQGPAVVFPQVLCFRGVSGIDRVLVLLDDLPLNDGLTGSPNLNMLPADDLLRVEVLRGPFSALYGNHAMGGVLHVVTKPGGIDPGAAVETSLGMFGALHGAAKLAGKIGKFEAALHYDVSSTDNYLADPDGTNQKYLHQGIHARVDALRGSPLSLTLTGGWFDAAMGFDQEVDLRRQGIDLVLLNAGENVKQNGHAQATLRWLPVKGLELKGHAGFLYMAQSWQTVPVLLAGTLPGGLDDMMAGQDVAMDSWRVRLSLLGRWQPAGGLTVEAGFEQVWDMGAWDVYRHGGGSFGGGGLLAGMDARTSTTAGFVELGWKSPGGKARLSAGVRLDRHSTFGLAWSPKLTAAVSLWKGGTVRWSYGRAFRAPSIAELYTPAWMRIPPVLTEGNEGLLPENVDAVDLGIEQRLGSLLTLRAAGFHVVGKNFIAFQMQPDGIEKYVNLGRVRTAGVELEAELAWRRILHVRLAYAWTWSEDVATGQAISYVPEHLLGLSAWATVPAGPVDIVPAFDLHVVGRRWHTTVRGDAVRYGLDPYAVGSARLAVAWGVLTFFVEARNLWDAKYEETAYLAAPRFLFLGGVKVQQPL